MKLPIENSHQVFKTRRVRYVRADELELYSSKSTTLPVKRRHQLTYVEVLLLFTHCRWMNTSTARQECATLSLYTTFRTTDTAPMLSLAGCQNSTALTSIHCSIRSRVEVNFVDVCGFDARRGSPELQQVRLPVRPRFSRRRLRFSLRTHTSVLLCTRIQYVALAIILRLGRTDAWRQNFPTTNVRSMSYRHTGVMLYQALCGVEQQQL